jgi:hypothetical protein
MKKKHIVCVYKVHSCLVSTFLNNIQTIIQHHLKHCSIITMGDFNFDILRNNNQTKKKPKTIRFH